MKRVRKFKRLWRKQAIRQSCTVFQGTPASNRCPCRSRAEWWGVTHVRLSGRISLLVSLWPLVWMEAAHTRAMNHRYANVNWNWDLYVRWDAQYLHYQVNTRKIFSVRFICTQEDSRAELWHAHSLQANSKWHRSVVKPAKAILLWWLFLFGWVFLCIYILRFVILVFSSQNLPSCSKILTVFSTAVSNCWQKAKGRWPQVEMVVPGFGTVACVLLKRTVLNRGTKVHWLEI